MPPFLKISGIAAIINRKALWYWFAVLLHTAVDGIAAFLGQQTHGLSLGIVAVVAFFAPVIYRSGETICSAPSIHEISFHIVVLSSFDIDWDSLFLQFFYNIKKCKVVLNLLTTMLNTI